MRLTVLERLAGSHGYLVVGRDGLCGAVETPLFPPDGGEPDYLVVRIGSRIRPRFPIVAVALVQWVDPDRELVYFDGTQGDLAALPEQLPLAI